MRRRIRKSVREYLVVVDDQLVAEVVQIVKLRDRDLNATSRHGVRCNEQIFSLGNPKTALVVVSITC